MGENQTENAVENAEIAEDNKEMAEKEEDDLDLESFGKKKKKKKKVVEFDGEEKGAEYAGEKEVAGEDDIDLESFGKKKKKKNKNRTGDIEVDDMDDGENKENDDTS